jgi:hypothetical protein
MPSVAEYRQHAAECLRLAREAKTDPERDMLLKMAEEWGPTRQSFMARQARRPRTTHRNGRNRPLGRSFDTRVSDAADLHIAIICSDLWSGVGG